MGTVAKKRNIFSILFSSEIDVEDYDSVLLPKELEDARKALVARENEIKKGFNKSTKGGFAKKIDPKTEEAMRVMHSKVLNNEQKISDRERD